MADFSWLRALSDMKMPGELSTGGQMPGVPPLGINPFEAALANVPSREAMADVFGALAWPAKALARVPADAAAARKREAMKESVGKSPEQQAADVFKPDILQPSPIGPDALAAIPLRLSGPMKAYHASPYRFDKFNFEQNLGKGEGAQVYTQGGYFAQNPRVMDSYFNQFPPRFQTPSDISERARVAVEHVMREGVDAMLRPSKAAMEALRSKMRNAYQADWLASQRAPNSPELRAFEDRYYRDIDRAFAEGKFSDPTRYKVALHTDPTKLLQLDMPMLMQPPTVKQAFAHSPVDRYVRKANPTAHEAYKLLGKELYVPPSPSNAAEGWGPRARAVKQAEATEATKFLQKEGVDGAMYPDEYTRFARGGEAPKRGTFNIVTYRDDIIQILRKWGIPAAGIGTILSGLAGPAPKENIQ